MIQTDIAKIGIHSKAKNSQYNSANNLPNNNACVILKEDLGRGKGGATVTLPPKDWLQAHHLPPLLLRHHMALERNPQESSLGTNAKHEQRTLPYIRGPGYSDKEGSDAHKIEISFICGYARGSHSSLPSPDSTLNDRGPTKRLMLPPVQDHIPTDRIIHAKTASPPFKETEYLLGNTPPQFLSIKGSPVSCPSHRFTDINWKLSEQVFPLPFAPSTILSFNYS
eukprot:CAMPEP_0184682698 /NCGR_PEP_ID=MMETSP0312-20130426/8381_1 /TAXON_ID=31354 /ORGANISM="Compsopogon coeruleus, Strain SAG 36.94" /LENGTH=223 /DNA_ID=CAMNT_0027134533 /DNA_START=215 /DNA_END=884 /DNA_ORIENTATION=+